MTEAIERLALRIVDTAAHAGYPTALIFVAVMSLGIAALSLWALTVVVKAVVARKR